MLTPVGMFLLTKTIFVLFCWVILLAYRMIHF